MGRDLNEFHATTEKTRSPIFNIEPTRVDETNAGQDGEAKWGDDD
jgi:hypothetical protein